MSKQSAAYDIPRGQILLQQCAIDALLMTHPCREELAEAFTASSAGFIKMISDQAGFEVEAIEIVKMMRAPMLRRLGRTEHWLFATSSVRSHRNYYRSYLNWATNEYR